MKHISVRIDPTLYSTFAAVCATKRVTVSQQIRSFVEMAVETTELSDEIIESERVAQLRMDLENARAVVESIESALV